MKKQMANTTGQGKWLRFLLNGFSGSKSTGLLAVKESTLPSSKISGKTSGKITRENKITCLEDGKTFTNGAKITCARESKMVAT